jgi:hypothetical protein
MTKTTRNKVGKGSGEDDKAKEFNLWRSSKPATMAKATENQ